MLGIAENQHNAQPITAGRQRFAMRLVKERLVGDIRAATAVRIYVATGTTDLRRSIDAFSLKSKVRTIKKARSGMAIA